MVNDESGWGQDICVNEIDDTDYKNNLSIDIDKKSYQLHHFSLNPIMLVIWVMEQWNGFEICYTCIYNACTFGCYMQ